MAEINLRVAATSRGRGPASRDRGLETELPDDEMSTACADEAHAQLCAALAQRSNRNPAFCDLDWNEDQRLTAWRAVIDHTPALPSNLAASGRRLDSDRTAAACP